MPARQRDQLGQKQFVVLGQVVGNMFEPADRLAPVRGPRGAVKHYQLVRAGTVLGKSVVSGMAKAGLLDADLAPTPAGQNLYLRALIERPAK